MMQRVILNALGKIKMIVTSAWDDATLAYGGFFISSLQGVNIPCTYKYKKSQSMFEKGLIIS